MAGKKYADDYRLDKQLTDSGKVRTTAVYQGDWYGFCREPEAIRSLSLTVLLASVGVLVLMFPLLLLRPNEIPISTSFFVVMPMAFVLLPVFRLFMVGIRLRRFQEPLTREQKDQTDVRLRRASIWLTVMTAVHLAGCGVYAYLEGLRNSDWIVVLCTGLELAVSVFLLTQRKKAETKITKKAEKKEKPKKSEEE